MKGGGLMVNILDLKKTPLYMMDKEINIIETYEPFSFVQIMITATQEIIIVDKGCISLRPDFTNSVSLKLFGGTI
jgi:hypothetical protein